MDFGTSPPQVRRRESIVPMINVVFLLLIFFLMTATIVPQPPFQMTLPEAGDAPETPGTAPLFVSADGSLAHRGAFGEAAITSIDPGQALEVRADARLAASELAALLPRLAALGIEEIRLVTVRAP
jgi:biopolymer transport protein ExbD